MKDSDEIYNALILAKDADTAGKIRDWLADTGRFETFEVKNIRDTLLEQTRRKPDVIFADVGVAGKDLESFIKKSKKKDRYCTIALYGERTAATPEVDAMFGVSLISFGDETEEKRKKKAAALIEELKDMRALAQELKILKLENDSFLSSNILKEYIQIEEGSLSKEALDFRAKEFYGKYITLVLILASDFSISGAEDKIMKMLLKFKYARFFCLNISRNRELLFVVSDKNPYERNLRSFGERMRRSIRIELGHDSTILISIPSPNGENLLTAYRKFDTLEENRFFLKEGDVLVDSASFTIKGSTDENVETLLMQLYEDIRYREFGKAAEGVKKTVARIEQEGSMSNIYVRHIFIEILSRLSQHSDVMTNNENMEAVKYILTAPDIWSIEEKVIKLLEQSEKRKKKTNANDSSIVIDKVIAIIRSEYKNSGLTMEYIAQKVFLSPNYLSAMFKRLKGESITSFLKNYRLERAKELLKNSNIKVKDIAIMVGFASDGYFATVFRKSEGISAAEYREMNSKRY